MLQSYAARSGIMDDIGIAPPAMATPKISAKESARRKAAVDYARGTLRLEGYVVSDAVEEFGRRYVTGEITTAEHSAAIRQRHGL